jgi:hypothetical protein
MGAYFVNQGQYFVLMSVNEYLLNRRDLVNDWFLTIYVRLHCSYVARY